MKWVTDLDHVLVSAGFTELPQDWGNTTLKWQSATEHLPFTNLGRVMHLCISKSGHHWSDNGLLPTQHQAIIWTNVGLLKIGPLETIFSEIWMYKQSSYNTINFNMSSVKWRQFCLRLIVYLYLYLYLMSCICICICIWSDFCRCICICICIWNSGKKCICICICIW